MWDTALSCTNSNALLIILPRIKACHRNRFILSVNDHPTRFVFLNPMKEIEAHTFVRHLIERVFSVLDSPETLHFDQETEFDNPLVKEIIAKRFWI